METGHSFLDLPAELRGLIYEQIFRNTRVTFGHIEVDYDAAEKVEYFRRITLPRANSLALLHTCRQVYVDLRHQWMSWVLFNFDSATALLSTLLPRGEKFISRIRYLRVCNSILWLKHPEASRPFGYSLLWCFHLLPGLQLHTLYVLAGCSIGRSYRDYEGPWWSPRTNNKENLYTLIGDLAICGTGWRHFEMHLANSEILDLGVYTSVSLYELVTSRYELARRWVSDKVSTPTYLEIVRAPAEKPREKTWSAMEVCKPRYLVTSIYDSFDFGPARVTHGNHQTDRDQCRRMIVRISRSDNADISHKSPYPELGYDTTLAGLHPLGLSPAALEDMPTSVHICKDLRTWLSGLSWQEIRLRYIDGTVLEYANAHKGPNEMESDDKLTYRTFSVRKRSHSKVLRRAVFDEHRRRNTVVRYDKYDSVFEFDDAWVVCSVGSAMHLESAIKATPQNGGRLGILWDKKWLESIGAICS